MIDKIASNFKKITRYPSLIGFFIFNFLENNNNPDIRTNGEKKFIERSFEILNSDRGNDEITCFDLGAAQGDYIKWLLSLSGDLRLKIHAFEPSKTSYDELLKKYLNSGNIFINNVAVSDKCGKGYIYFDRVGSLHTSLIKRNDLIVKLKNKKMVNKITLNSYINSSNIKHIHILKMDVEGSEMQVLNGLGKYLNSNFIDFIQFEYGGVNLDSRTNLSDFYKLLEKKGFLIGKILSKRVQIRKYQQWMDNFQMANYVAITKKIANRMFKD